MPQTLLDLDHAIQKLHEVPKPDQARGILKKCEGWLIPLGQHTVDEATGAKTFHPQFASWVELWQTYERFFIAPLMQVGLKEDQQKPLLRSLEAMARYATASTQTAASAAGATMAADIGNYLELRGYKLVAPSPTTGPVKWLRSWREILTALGMKNVESEKRMVQGLNRIYAGPIKSGGRGMKPNVKASALIEWWNDLESRVEERRRQQNDARATVQAQHRHRNATVVLDISGSVKSRRRR